jgi:hypothetical protein
MACHLLVQVGNRKAPIDKVATRAFLAHSEDILSDYIIDALIDAFIKISSGIFGIYSK